MQTNNPLACSTSTSNWDSQTLKWEGLALVMRKTFPTVRAGQIPGMNQGGVYKLPSKNALKSDQFSSIQGSSTDLPDIVNYVVYGAQSQQPKVHFHSLLFLSDNKKVADMKTWFRSDKPSSQLQFL